MREIIESLEKSPSKSCPSDPIPTRTLKSCLQVLLPAITNLMPESVTAEGRFPRCLQGKSSAAENQECLTGQRRDLNSFRPITNLTFVSKVIERTAAYQIQHYLTSNKLYPKLQAAYQQSHGTETALRPTGSKRYL